MSQKHDGSRGRRSLTLEQIGERAGVSRSTVSRVLNDHPDVRPEVRARVEEVIRETGYQPNQAARALVSNRSNLIGLVMLTELDELFGDPYYSALVTGIQAGCVEHDRIFSIFPVYRLGASDALAPQLSQGLIDGVIVTAGPRSEHLIGELHREGIRLVVIGHPAEDRELARVDVENRSGSAEATEHLLRHGRERVGFIGATPEHRYGVERLEGYRDAIERAGRQVDEELISLDDPTSEGGRRAAAALLRARPDAIFASTDPMAAGAYGAIREAGLRIPEDIAIVGFDGLPRGPQLDPPLTTIVQPVVDVGRTAVALLAADELEARAIVLPTSLRIGASCGDDDGLPAAPDHPDDDRKLR